MDPLIISVMYVLFLIIEIGVHILAAMYPPSTDVDAVAFDVVRHKVAFCIVRRNPGLFIIVAFFDVI